MKNNEETESESEWEEQETLVIVELSGVLETDLLQKSEGNCKVLGVNTEKPLLQLDNYTFTGEYEDTLGTCLLFEEKSSNEGNSDRTGDGLDRRKQEEKAKTHLEFNTVVTKKLCMTRAFITPQTKESDNRKDSPCQSMETTESHTD